MGRKNSLVYMVTAVLLVLLAFCALASAEGETPALWAELSLGTNTEPIEFWQDGQAGSVLFLPAGTSCENVRLRTNADGAFSLDGQPIRDGDPLSGAEGSRIQLPDGTEKQLKIVFSEGLPVLYIDTASGSMDAIHADRAYSENGSLRLYDAHGEALHRGNLESINGRGNASWYARDKKPYSLTLTGEADLLGMGRGKNWVLLANAAEHTHMKNKAVFDLADAAGLAYTPDSRWVEVYLNGEYAGLYLLCERNEIHTNRVDISGSETFLVSMELESRLIKRQRPYVRTEAGQAMRIHSSSMEETQILAVLQSAENAILAPDGIDPVTGRHWQELIDLESWVRKYLLEEVVGNGDACSISQFFYYDGGKLYAGPAWDYDGAMTQYVPQTLYGCRFQACEGKPIPWFHSLYQQEVFYNRVVELYRTTFRPLVTQLLDEGMDAYAAGIASAVDANLIRWPDYDPEAYLNETKAYMRKRLKFLDSLWLEGETYCFVYADFGEEINGAIFAVRPGETLPDLRRYTYYDDSVTYHGWYEMGTGGSFDLTQPIYENTAIYLKQTKSAPVPEAPMPEESAAEPLTMLRLGPVVALLAGLGCLLLAEHWKTKKRCR